MIISAPVPHLLAFSPYTYGHHADSVRYQVEYWTRVRPAAMLTYVVNPQFLEAHPDVVALIEQAYDCGLRVQMLTQAETDLLRDRARREDARYHQLLQGSLADDSAAAVTWDLWCKYATRLHATQALLLFADTCLPALATHRAAPVPFACLLFQLWQAHEALHPQTPQVRLRGQVHRMLFKRILEHPQLQTCFTHDHYALTLLQELAPARVQFLPDRGPDWARANQDVAGLRQELGIDPGRTVYLLFGHLDARKGLPEVSQAMAMLPEELAQRAALVVVGHVPVGEKATVDKAQVRLGSVPGLQAIFHNEFVPEPEILRYFRLADVILIVYRQHVGSSGVLVTAAIAGRPVLACDYGLIGMMTQRYGLGVTVDSSDPAAIAAGITRFLVEPHPTLYDPVRMQALADESTPERYAATLFAEMRIPQEVS